MFEIKHVHFDTIKNQRAEYQKFTDKNYFPCLDGIDPFGRQNAAVIAIAALLNDHPVGLALAGFHTFFSRGKKNLNMGEIFSIQTDKNHLDLLAKLVGHTQEILYLNECVVAVFNYEEKQEEMYLEAFQECSWEGPRNFIAQYYFKSELFSPPWLKKVPEYPEGFEEFPWKELKGDEKLSILRDIEKGIVPSNVSPLTESESSLIEPINSLGLRYKGKVAGWMITHRINQDTIRYTALYIQRDLRSKSLSVRLLADSIEKHILSKVKWALFELRVQDCDPGWKVFVEKRLSPYAQKTNYIKQMWKDFKLS